MSNRLEQQLEQRLPAWRKLTQLAATKETPLYLVGGALRDLLREKEISDVDLACRESDLDFWETNIPKLWGGHFITMGTKAGQFKTRRLVGQGITIDLAVLEGDDLENDLARRDFTINAMALGLHDDLFHDPHRGREDLDARRIEVVAPQNLLADPLRIVRAIRFQLELGGQITPATREAMRAATAGLETVAGERLAVEFDHIFATTAAGSGIRELAAVGALQTIFPALGDLAGLPQNNYHHLDALEHTLAVLEELDRLCQNNPFALEISPDDLLLLKWAGLFHDTGKALTRTLDTETGIIHFYGHERFSAHLAGESLENFALGKNFIRRLKRLIENHLRPLQLNLRDCREKSLRRLVFDLEEDLGLLLLHALADLEATRGRDPRPRIANLLELGRKLLTIFEQEKENLVKPLLSGRDLLELGMDPGPGMGVLIRLLHKRQIAGEIRNREEALAAARKLLSESTTEMKS